MKKHTIILERGDGDLWGQLTIEGFLLTTVGADRAAVEANIRELIADYVEHGDLLAEAGENLEFEFGWHVEGLFEEFAEINLAALARSLGMNPTLLRQYANGDKNPSDATAKRIETGLRSLGERLVLARAVA